MCTVQKHTTQGNKTHKVKGALLLISQTSQANVAPDALNMAPWTLLRNGASLSGGQRCPVPFDIKQGRRVLQLSGLQDGFLLSNVLVENWAHNL